MRAAKTRFGTGRWAVIVLAAMASVMAPVANAQLTSCAALRSPVHVQVDPVRGANLLTLSAEEARDAPALGFTESRGTPVRAAGQAARGLWPVHRLAHPGSGDLVWIADPAEILHAVTSLGYVDQGVGFHALRTAAGCTTPVHRLRRGDRHRHAFTDAERAALESAGWTYETVSFHAAPHSPDADGRFSFAVIPDTQNEVFAGAPATRHVGRARWLAEKRDALDLRFVLHSGDVTNWGERDEPQYQVAAAGLVPLEQAGIPVAYTPGNHDTRAVCAGGSACPGESASVNVRFLPLFSQTFGQRFAVGGRMEPGKLDNYYTLFQAGGVDWLVLSLELWPRTAAIDWAKSVVAAHPRHNVIVVTHMYLNADGSISTSNGGYGANSPMVLYDQLVKRYANIRFVFSGHVGLAAHRVDTGVHGNRIASFLQSFHSQSNPVRIVEIDTVADEASTWVYAPHTQQQFPEYDVVVGDMGFVARGADQRPPVDRPRGRR